MLLTLALITSAAVPQESTIQTKVKEMTARIAPERLEQTIRALVACKTRHVQSMEGKEQALLMLEKEVGALVPKAKGRLSMKRETYEVPSTRLSQRVSVTNLVATLRGVSDPERLYVFGGHYDSINSNPKDHENAAPGANDDGSGTAAVLEALTVMCEREFAATILFCFYDGEEQGLLGSTAHADALAKQGAKIDGMITNDICGNTLGMDKKRYDTYMRCFSYAARGNDSPGRSFARAAAFAQRTHVPKFELRLVFRGDRFGRGGDHKPFENHGWPALRFSEAHEDFSRQHQNVTERDGKPYGDLPEFVDYQYLARFVAVDVATLAEVASAPPPFDRITVTGSRTSYDTMVTYQVDHGDDAELVWRMTTAPDWEQTFRLLGSSHGGAQGTTLSGVCVDDVVIGIRRIGVDGSRSRAITPAEPDAVDQRGATQPSSRRSGR